MLSAPELKGHSEGLAKGALQFALPPSLSPDLCVHGEDQTKGLLRMEECWAWLSPRLNACDYKVPVTGRLPGNVLGEILSA